MGRGRVQLRRIENKIRRQVTFSKRRTGLVKKAQEISVLCDADVALIVFSPKGKLFEYSAGSSMERILDRYERSSYAGQDIPTPNLDSQGECSTECSKLLRMIDVLQRSLRHLRGEEVDGLSMRELQGLEMQLDTALKRTRSRKAGEREDFQPQNLSHDLASLATPPCESPHALPWTQSPPPPPLSSGDTSQRNGEGEVADGTLIRRTNTTLPHWMPRLTGE
ncbi:unnamed protein product [Arabidopsis arenosa]|uniref:Uncharacterized protein n=1 Tax=Arabidopsis arenosa TaxID=38785 RepID=A0A8S2A995_ARAAE|nr:unnamed protein product [Arabidopsis arenosa]